MRRFLVLLVVLVPCVIPALGCQKSRPDPREQPGFVDDTNPDLTVQSMGNTDEQGNVRDNKDKKDAAKK